jgi:hypothetical protein
MTEPTPDCASRPKASAACRVQVGIDRRLGIQRGAPQFEILVLRAEADVVETASMIVRVNEGGHGQEIVAMRARGQLSDAIADHPDFNVPARLFASRYVVQVLNVDIHGKEPLACQIATMAYTIGPSLLFG